jgi:acetylornithine deacetylase/succinyl-diaminopimelate desuccinylase-like protein
MDDRHNAYIAAGKKVKKEGKWNRDLEIIAKEDEECHVDGGPQKGIMENTARTIGWET